MSSVILERILVLDDSSLFPKFLIFRHYHNLPNIGRQAKTQSIPQSPSFHAVCDCVVDCVYVCEPPSCECTFFVLESARARSKKRMKVHLQWKIHQTSIESTHQHGFVEKKIGPKRPKHGLSENYVHVLESTVRHWAYFAAANRNSRFRWLTRTAHEHAALEVQGFFCTVFFTNLPTKIARKSYSKIEHFLEKMMSSFGIMMCLKIVNFGAFYFATTKFEYSAHASFVTDVSLYSVYYWVNEAPLADVLLIAKHHFRPFPLSVSCHAPGVVSSKSYSLIEVILVSSVEPFTTCFCPCISSIVVHRFDIFFLLFSLLVKEKRERERDRAHEHIEFSTLSNVPRPRLHHGSYESRNDAWNYLLEVNVFPMTIRDFRPFRTQPKSRESRVVESPRKQTTKMNGKEDEGARR